MNKLEKDVLEKHFPKLTSGENHRYNRDDILNVLTFMREHPHIQLKTIEEFSHVSMGALVSWRKKYGQYVGIKTKVYANQPGLDAIEKPLTDANINNNQKNGGLKPVSRISLALIRELEKAQNDNALAEFTVDGIIFRVQDGYLHVLEKAD